MGSPKRKRGSRRICFNTFFGSPKICLISFSRADYYGDKTSAICTVTYVRIYEISLLLYGATLEFEGHCILTPFSPPPIHVYEKRAIFALTSQKKPNNTWTGRPAIIMPSNGRSKKERQRLDFCRKSAQRSIRPQTCTRCPCLGESSGVDF